MNIFLHFKDRIFMIIFFKTTINWFLNKMITNDLLTILQDDCYHCHFETSDSINKIKLRNIENFNIK